MRRGATLASTLAAGWSVFAGLALAQDPRGSILGTVADPSGAVIPRVEVRAVNSETGVAASATTNEAGRFQIPFLLPGNYRVTAELTGFKRFVQDGVQVRVSETSELAIAMEVGAVSESVEVREQTPLLDTSSSSLGRVIDRERVLALPVRGGNPIELELLTPGVVNGTNLRLRKPSSPDALSSISADGNDQTHNEYQIDGIFNGAADGGRGASRVAFSPPAEAVREFKMQTSPYDAGVGHTIGAVMSVSTTSGTNDLHGEAHFSARNSAFDAPNFFNNKAGTKPGKYRDDRYGVSAGAPVLIPRLFNGKNRTFWFYAWERDSPWTDPRAWVLTVPTAAQRQGDFSALLQIPRGSSYQLYDPFTTTPAPGGRFSRQPLANNVIPRSRLDPVGQKLVNLYALPNQPGTVDGRNNFFNGADVDLNKYYVNLARFDHAFSDSHRVFFRLHADKYEIRKWTYFSPTLLDSDGLFQNRINKGVSLDDVWVMSATLVLNVRYGLTNTRFPQWRISRGYDLASLGFSPALINLVDKKLATVPNTVISGYTALSEFERPGDGTNTSLTHSLTGNVTKLQGRHSLRFGVDARLERGFGNRYPNDVSPRLEYSNSYIRGPLDNSPAAPIGQELAAMLLGVPGGYMDRSASSAVQDIFTGIYFQDDFKVTGKLTLNLGLRYELEAPIREKHDRLIAGFDFDSSNPIEAAARANYARDPIAELPVDAFRVRGGLTWVNQGGRGRSPFPFQKNELMPRVGLAYLLDAKTNLRAGYGIYYDSLGVYAFLPLQTGFSQQTPIQASLDSGLTYIASNANPFPNGLMPPLGPAGGLTTNLNQSISFFYPNLKHPYSQRWSFGVQRLLPGQFLLETSYVGNRATRLGVTRNYNNTPAQYLSTKPYRDQATIDFLSQTFPNPFRGLNPTYGANISRGNLLRPYPEFGSISAVEPIGYSWYHSLQVQAEKRLSQGYTFQLGYTFSKVMEAVAFLNATDPVPYRSIAALDRPHRLTMSGVWEIPVGRGRRFGPQLWAPVNFFVGGWQLAGTVIRQAGGALGFGEAIFNGGIKNIALPKSQRSADRWFNVDAGFNRSSAEQRSSALRTFPLRFGGVRGNGQASWDFSILKDFPIRERFKMQFRAQVFNAWNHTNLGSPNTSPTNSSFGMVTGTEGEARNWQFALKLSF